MPFEAGLGGTRSGQYRSRETQIGRDRGDGETEGWTLSRKTQQRIGEALDRLPSERLSDSCADDL